MMSNQFDELTNGMARAATRRTALKKFDVGFPGINLARLGLGVLTLLTFTTQIYAQGGIPLWTNRYSVPADRASAQAVAVDSAGNVFVTGFAPIHPNGPDDYVTIGYSSSGVPLWTNRYDGVADQDESNAIAVDKSGNVFITGASVGSTGEFEYTTLAYSGTGVALWTNHNVLGHAYAIAVDGTGNVFITGESFVDSSGTYEDGFGTIKFSGAGVPLWTNFYNGLSNGRDSGLAMAVDGSGNVFVTGSSQTSDGRSDWVTVKYSNAGVALWTNRYDGAEPNAIAVDRNGNVFVTGSGSPGGGATIGYSNSGVLLWTNRCENPQTALTVNNSGYVFVAGYIDFVTGYSSSGVPLWTNRYEGGSASAVAADSAGNVFVTGASYGSGGTPSFATIAYSGAGVPLWTNRYLAPGDTVAVPMAIAVDANGNVVVAGCQRSLKVYHPAVEMRASKCTTWGAEPEAANRPVAPEDLRPIWPTYSRCTNKKQSPN